MWTSALHRRHRGRLYPAWVVSRCAVAALGLLASVMFALSDPVAARARFPEQLEPSSSSTTRPAPAEGKVADDRKMGEPGGTTMRTYLTGAERDRRRAEAREVHERSIASLQNARSAEREARAHLDDLNGEAAEIEGYLRNLGRQERDTADRVAVARRHAREYVVEAYIGGGPPSFTEYFLDTDDANDLTWRRWMIRDHLGRAFESVDELSELRQGVDHQVDDIAERLDRNRSSRQDAQNDLQRAGDEVMRAEDALAEAEQERREAELEVAEELPPELFESLGYRGAGDDGSPTPDQSGNAKGPGWAALRQCESSGNYNIVDSSGTYRGAYQFDLQTWRSVGGHGDPVDNTTAEQDLRAQILYDSRGAQPWPICGRHLRPPPTEPATSTTTPSSESTTTTTAPPAPLVPRPTQQATRSGSAR